MKKLIKRLLRESLIGEVAKTPEQLPKGTGLFYKKGDSHELVLFNPKSKEAYGIINFVHNPSESNFYYVIAVAAEKDFGPLMYELAMMYVNDKHTNMLTPTRSGDIRGAAWSVWERMFKREDIKKDKLDITDNNFRFDLITGEKDEISPEEKLKWFDEASPDEQLGLRVFNSGYSKQPSDGYEKLIQVANQYGEDTYELASKIGDDLWQASYK